MVKPELGSQEQLLWSGQPRHGLVFRANDLLMTPFSLLWGGFAIFWEASVLRSNGPLIMKLWGIPFVLVGLHMIAGRFVVEAWKRKRIFYGVTNERVIILSNFFSRNVYSINLRTLSDVVLSQKSDGSGTIVFGGASKPSRWAFLKSRNNREADLPTFEEIQEAEKIYGIIREAHTRAQAKPSSSLTG